MRVAACRRKDYWWLTTSTVYSPVGDKFLAQCVHGQIGAGAIAMGRSDLETPDRMCLRKSKGTSVAFMIFWAGVWGFLVVVRKGQGSKIGVTAEK